MGCPTMFATAHIAIIYVKHRYTYPTLVIITFAYNSHH